MKLENEREVKMIEFDLEDLTTEEVARLKEVGLREIVKDDVALINYAINYILREMINQTEGSIEVMKKLLKKKSNKRRP